MKTSLIVAAAAVSFLAAPAFSADLPVKAPPVVPAAATPWTGFYLGLGIGARASVVDASVTSATMGSVPPLNLLSAGFCNAANPCIPGESVDNTAFRVGPYVGYNWQWQQWLVGVEGDWGWADGSRTLSGMMAPGGNSINLLASGLGDSSYSVKTTWDASIRGRFGWVAVPNVLLYGTAGAAWLHVEQTSVCGVSVFLPNCSPFQLGPAAITDSTDRLGWTVGGGLEAMLWTNWIVRGEYRYADFGTWSPTDVRATAAGTFPVAVTDAVRIRTHTATFGLAYKF